MRLLCACAALLAARLRGEGFGMNEPVETPRRNLTAAVVPALAAAGLAALAVVFIVMRNGGDEAAAAPQNCILENADGVGGPIDLVDSNGTRVTQADFAGEPAVLYFGFTNCPDVCPTSMYTLNEALQEGDGYDVQSILVTVDPARDTPERMGSYTRTPGFPSGLVGLSGSQAQIDAAKRAFQVYSTRVEIPGAEPDVYNVDHSSLLYVLDSQWRTVSIIPTMSRADMMDPRSPMVATPPDQISACIAAGLERAGRS